MESSDQQHIFRILMATDNHLGYNEKDPEKGNDSFNTFEEILELAVENEVDFILLAGDLFHENKPSRNALLRCIQLLRKYSYGDKPAHFDFVSDPTENFPHLKNPTVNYLDPNLNVGIPVFSIHGNHDDPSGLGQHSPLELLSTSGLINYFGRVSDLNEIKISPLLLTKGRTKLAIYGLSAIKDERLFRLFKERKVKMLRPKEDLDDWFNVLVLHQNHTKHSISSYIPEQFLDKFLDLVIWGHEHECLIEPRLSEEGFLVTQPGSSVATSLCAGEAVQKKVALLEINPEKRIRITDKKLKTVRPFVFDDLCLKDYDLPLPVKNKQNNPVEDFVEERVLAMVEKAKKQLTGHSRQPNKPLIRLRVEYTDESQMFNVVRFGYKFADVVANPEDLILFKKFKSDAKKDADVGLDRDVMDSVFDSETPSVRVEDLVEKYFAELEDDVHQLQLLSERGLAYAVGQYIEKDDTYAVQDMFMHQVDKASKYLMGLDDLEEDKIEEELVRFRQARLSAKGKQEEDDVIAALKNPKRGKKTSSVADDFDSDVELLDDDDDETISVPTSGRGRGGRGSRRRGGASAGSRARGRGRASGNKSALQFNGDEDDDYVSPRGKGRGRRTSNRSSTTSTRRQPSIANLFSSSSQKLSRSQRKGAIFDSDSDE